MSPTRYAASRKSPGFALTVSARWPWAGILAASFSVFSAMVLRPFAVRDPWSLYGSIGKTSAESCTWA